MRTPEVPGIDLEAELGRGAHSIVYRGRERASGRACAVKLPLTRARWTRWIYREAVALARVTHPRLPAVIEVGEAEGLPYLVMEIVEGQTLADVLAQGTVSEELAVQYAAELAEVLTAVHDAGLVHRDVKPRNIVVTNHGLKLVDFGFATPMERTGAGETAGTAAYAAPEQLTPPGRVDSRADLYGIGRVLLECLDGDLFSLTRTDRGRELRQDLIRAGAAPNLAEILGSLLQPDPVKRYATARALLGDLRRHQRGLPALGPFATNSEREPCKPVARTAELALLLDALRRGHGRGSVVVLEGGSGSGKTRLMRAATAVVASDMFVAEGASREGDPPLALLRRLLEAALDERGSLGGLRREDLHELFGSLVPILDLIAPGLLHAASAAREPALPLATDALVEGAAELFLRLSRRLGKCVIFADDSHWMDELSHLALLRLAHRLGEAPVSIVLSGRREGRHATDRVAAFRTAEVPVTAIELAPLGEDAIERVLCAYLSTGKLDRSVVRRICAMADGTPLSALEALGAFLDAGVLRPHAGAWQFEPSFLERVVLPNGVRALLGRRLAELPQATRRVLEAAAIIGSRFDEDLLTSVLDVASEVTAYAMVSSLRTGVIEQIGPGAYRFVHDSLRESLLDELGVERRADLHHQAAVALADAADETFDGLCRAARHFQLGHPEREPALVFRVAAAGARAALEHYDDETAIHLTEQAVNAAAVVRIKVPSTLFRVEAEARLRMGSIERSILAFERALSGTTDPLMRAELLGRIAWAHQVNAEPEKSWAMLAAAFRALGKTLPAEDVTSAARTTMAILQRRAGARTEAGRDSPETNDLVCRLHYQNARLGAEYGRVARVLQSGLASKFILDRDTPQSTRARATALYAFVVMGLGRRDAGIRHAKEALALAKTSRDPTATSFCTEMLGMVTSWSGRIDEALAAFATCLDDYGPWNETSEYCIIAMSGALMTSLRGDARGASVWAERAVGRLRRGHEFPRIALSVVHGMRAALAAQGLVPEPSSWLAQQCEKVPAHEMGQGYHRILSWGPRAAYLLAQNDFGPTFEALVSAFESEKHNPRTVHMSVMEYYVAVMHARLQQCLRAPRGNRLQHVDNLAHAAKSLRKAARVPLLEAHALLAEGALEWLRNGSAKATRILADAEVIAVRENAPWVLSAVARTRAHMLLAEGKTSAATDQARVAYALAADHGAVARARAIREEFPAVVPAVAPAAPPPSLAQTSRRDSSSRTHRHLAALIHVAKWPRRDVRPEAQAETILDELIETLGATRGALFFQSEPAATPLLLSRQQGSNLSLTLPPSSARATLLRRVQQAGETWPTLDGHLECPVDAETPIDLQRALVVPLFLYETSVGAVAVERATAGLPYRADERQLLELLAHQVPIALEIARLLNDREQMQQSLQHSQKMQAIGQLAGGIAHDFNNMLAAMKIALGVAQERAVDDEVMRGELDVVADATTRAAQLTQQLLSFSRSEPRPVQVHEVNQLVNGMVPMLRRVVPSNVDVGLKLSPAVDSVSIDSGAFDQALMNLCINARDAMPLGGKLTIATRNVMLDENAAIRADVTPGPYVEVEVTDTGEGMSTETLQRIFEPFFTTKPAGRGTGLGLASVYAFVKNCSGGIVARSERGVGTTFTLYLKRAERRTVRRSSTARALLSSRPPGSSPDTILVIDDDDLVRRSIVKILERNGYRVVAAAGSDDALELARSQQGKRIGLIIMDVLLPGVTGPELGRRLSGLLSAKVLFVSGFSPESAPIEDAKLTPAMLLQKPFTQNALIERVRELLPS